MRARPAPGGAWRPLVAGLATLAIVGAVLWIVRKDLLAVGLMVLGLLALSGGAGFVLAPLMRRRAGGPDPGPPLLARPSFVIGLVATAAGAALAVAGFYELLRRAAS